MFASRTTTQIQALTLNRELEMLLHDAAVLRFYFPGSPMWEVQRKLRRNGVQGR